MIQYNVTVIGRVMEKGFFFLFLIPRNPEMVGFLNLSSFSIPGTMCDAVESRED